MDSIQVKVKAKFYVTVFLLAMISGQCTCVFDDYVELISFDSIKIDGAELARTRYRRDVAEPAPPAPAEAPAAAPAAPVAAPVDPASTTVTAPASSASAPTSPVTTPQQNTTANVTDDSNRTTDLASNATTPPPGIVTKIPLLGVNGSGILHVNVTTQTTKVSDPIIPDENLPDLIAETPEMIKAEQNITNLTYDNHEFYKSYFIGNESFFSEHWKNITSAKGEVHLVLSNSYRRATTMKLGFDFPFYGHPLHSITVATGGFIYTGDHVHNWLAATQYIAPLMANFDTTLTNDSYVKLFDDGEKFTSLWENVTLREKPDLKFTFAVTLYKNGDIIFAYKDIPIEIQSVNDTQHPVKVGISDAYLTDRIIFYVRRKTIYEYHRVSFKNHEITNHTILKLEALPTCLQYNSCETCVNHNTGFNCSWCEQTRRCSSGTDRNKQDWLLRNCEKFPIYKTSMCPAPRVNIGLPINETDESVTYKTDQQSKPFHDSVVISEEGLSHSAENRGEAIGSPIGGAVVGFIAVALVGSVAAWILYAFKNPHTRSGQFLIKYRPSQWSWRRGEARYTAATIHM